MPWKSCCPEHDTPFDMAWSLWTGNPASFIAIGARDSFKTLTLAGSESMDIIHNACGVVHIGAIESQALKCYSYVKRNMRKFSDMLAKPPLLSRTDVINGGHLEIIPCTINRVNSPHEPKVRFDEVELADPVSYEEAKFIASSDEKGNAASICYTTTRKFSYGLAQKEVESAIKAMKRVLLWCYKDVTERCSDDRSGKDVKGVYVNLKTLEWSKKYNGNKEFKEFEVRNKCLDCKILPTCRGDLKRANGIKSIDDVIIKFENSSLDYWLAQAECKRPSKSGLMIWNFDSDVNGKKIDWNIFMDDKGNFNRARYFMVWGKDWGWNPDATLVAIIDKHTDFIYIIKEFRHSQKTTPDIAVELVKWIKSTPFGFPEDIQCDKSEPGLIAILKANGLDMAAGVEESDVEAGCDLINYLCKTPTGRALLFIDNVLCPTTIWEMEVGYIRANDPKTNKPSQKPRDKFNHFVDCLRYIVYKYMQKYLAAAGEYTNTTSLEFKDELGIAVPNSFGGLGEEDMELYQALLLNSDR